MVDVILKEGVVVKGYHEFRFFILEKKGGSLRDIPDPNLDTEMSIELSVAFYRSMLHIYYLISLYWPDLKC